MSDDPGRQQRLRGQQISAAVFIVVLVIGAVLRARGSSAGLVLIEVAVALLIVGLILVLARRNLTASASTLAQVRSTMDLAYNCYYEGGKRGIIAQRDGVLHLLRTKRSKTEDYLTLPAGSYRFERGDVAITAARRADGLNVKATDAEPTDGGLRIALSQDAMTLTGNMLKGPELDDVQRRLQHGAQRGS